MNKELKEAVKDLGRLLGETIRYHWWTAIATIGLGPFSKKRIRKTFAEPLQMLERAAKEKRID